MTTFRGSELLAMARVVHGVAGGEPLDAQIAVAFVILNRIRASRRRFGGGTVKGVCEKLGSFLDLEDSVFDQILHWLRLVVNGSLTDPTDGCKYFSNPWKRPDRKGEELELVREIGQLRFYRRKRSRLFCTR